MKYLYTRQHANIKLYQNYGTWIIIYIIILQFVFFFNFMKRHIKQHEIQHALDFKMRLAAR